MNTTLIDINEILVLLDKIMDELSVGKIIRTGNEFYEEYRKKIKSFVQKNKIDEVYPNIYTFLCKYYFTKNYTVDMNEARAMKNLVVELKNVLFPNLFEKIFISHREKDKKYTDALVELLHAIGIPRQTIDQKEGMIFCSSHPEGYINNAERNFDVMKSYFTTKDNVFFILFYSDFYFESQACLNEQGAVWATNQKYQEILTPNFSTDKIKGLLDKQQVWFRCNDKYRLNTFKEQLEKMFYLEPLAMNAWEIARDRFIEQIEEFNRADC
jgi:hypothetical protein